MKMWSDPAYTPARWLDYARCGFDEFLRHVKDHDGVWFATRHEIAKVTL